MSPEVALPLDAHLISKEGVMGQRLRSSSDLHSQFALSGANIFRMSILRRPWDVCRITSGSTPISFPTLVIRSAWITPGVNRACARRMRPSCPAGRSDLRVPVLDDGFCGINYGPIHVKEEAVEGGLDRGSRILIFHGGF